MNQENQSSNQNPFGRTGLPLMELMSLNMKTFQSFSYLKPEDFAQKKPEQIFEKNINIIFSNGHKFLSYLGEVFHIFEKQFSQFSQSESQSRPSEGSNSKGKSARKKREMKLDKTIESTFPASDAIAKY